MPDLIGLVQTGAPGPNDRAALEGMRRAAFAFRGGTWRDAAGGRLAAIVHHPRDPVFAADDLAGADLVALGPVWDADSALELVEAVRTGDHRGLARLPPPFAAAVRLRDSGATFLVTDPFGLHPLHYAHDAQRLLLASKPGLLVASGGVDPELDRAAVVELFTFAHVTGDRSLTASVSLAPPGSVLRFERGRLEISSYAALRLDGGSARGEALAAALHEALGEAVGRLPADARIGLPLSGGLDSRALLGAVVEAGREVRAFTFGDASCPDVACARAVARRAGVEHTLVPVEGRYLERWLDHGVAVTGGTVSCTEYHILALADVLAEHCDVVLDGLGGDALTGAHLAPQMLLARSAAVAARALRARRAVVLASPAALRAVFEPDFLDGFESEHEDASSRHFEELEGAPPWWGCHRFDLRERQRRFVQFGAHQLRPFVDVRTPFYEPAFVRLCLAAPARELWEQRAYLRMQARHFPVLSAVPEAGRGLSPAAPAVLRAAKRAADALRRRAPGRLASRVDVASTDYPRWFRHELHDWLRERLLDTCGPLQGIVRRDAAEKLLWEHREAGANHTELLACLLTLDAWLRSLSPFRG